MAIFNETLFKIYSLKNNTSNEKTLFYSFHLSLHVDYPRVDNSRPSKKLNYLLIKN